MQKSVRRHWTFWADLAGGDARAALNAIELGVLTTERSADGKIHVDLETAQECIQKRVVRYDKTGDQHYDTISHLLKVCGDLIRMQLSIIWRRCCMREKISNLLREESDLCRQKT